jgi:chromate reductase
VIVLGISGSLRSGSHNTSLLRAAGGLLAGRDRLELWDGLKDVPPYDEDDDVEPAPAAVARLRDAIAGADAVLFATPEYNSSIPGQLKNALDWLSRPLSTSVLRNKPVAVIGASSGLFGAVWAQAELRKVLAAIGARVVDVELPVAQVATKTEGGEIVHEATLAELQEVVRRLLAEVRPERVVTAEHMRTATAA